MVHLRRAAESRWLGGRWINAVVVVAVSAFVATVSQPWTGFNSPDSEFYASFALFGADVADRAVEPAYYWTRLGYIAPVRGLVSVFGLWWGFGIWRMVLIVMVVASVVAVVAISGRLKVLGAALALFVGLNTMVLAYLGNTYLSGTAMAVFFVLFALAVSYLGSAGARGVGPLKLPRWSVALASGLLVGWLIMLNPYAAILGVGMWATVRLVVVWKIRSERVRRLLVDLLAAVVGTVIGFSMFLFAGMQIFPGRSWWATYLEWNGRLDYAGFIGDGTTWQRDTALLVVVLSVSAAAIAVITQPRHRWAWAALAISVANVLVTCVLMIVMPGPWLEAPHYVALLWPGALMSLVLVFTSFSPGSKEPVSGYGWIMCAGVLLTVPLLLWSGRFEGVIALPLAWGMWALSVVGVLILGLLARRGWTVVVAWVLVPVMGIVFVFAQLWQNGRGSLGIYGQYPFRTAFVDYDFADQFASKVAVERWLIEQTTPEDSIVIWTDAQGLTADVAAMQMWGGYNIVTLDDVLDRTTTERLEEIRPTVLALYAPSRAQIDTFYASLPPWALPSELECVSEPYLGIGTGEVVACLTRLTWVG